MEVVWQPYVMGGWGGFLLGAPSHGCCAPHSQWQAEELLCSIGCLLAPTLTSAILWPLVWGCVDAVIGSWDIIPMMHGHSMPMTGHCSEFHAVGTAGKGYTSTSRYTILALLKGLNWHGVACHCMDGFRICWALHQHPCDISKVPE